MDAGNGGGECVGGVIRTRDFGKTQQDADRLLHLFLVGAGNAYNRLLDAVGRVFAERDAALGQGKGQNPARFGDPHGARDVPGKKEGFHAGFVGMVGSDYPGYFVVDGEEALRMRQGRTCFNVPVGNMDKAAFS